MNTLSKLLYLADVSQSLGSVMAICGAILVATAFFTGVATAMHNETSHEDDRLPYWSRLRGFVFAAFASFLIATVIPSRTTIYMIAASQFGEQIIQSEDALLLRNLVRKKIEDALTEATSSSSKK